MIKESLTFKSKLIAFQYHDGSVQEMVEHKFYPAKINHFGEDIFYITHNILFGEILRVEKESDFVTVTLENV